MTRACECMDVTCACACDVSRAVWKCNEPEQICMNSHTKSQRKSKK